MSTVLHRETLEIRRSVEPSLYSPESWLIDPDFAAVQNISQRHWKIVGESVIAMDEGEQEAVDLPLARAAKLAAIDAWWEQQAVAGIDVGNGVMLKSDSLDATQLQALLIQLAAAPDEFQTLVTDVNSLPVMTTAGEFRSLSVAYAAEFEARRTAWAMAKAAVLAATTVAEIEAVEVPTHG